MMKKATANRLALFMIGRRCQDSQYLTFRFDGGGTRHILFNSIVTFLRNSQSFSLVFSFSFRRLQFDIFLKPIKTLSKPRLTIFTALLKYNRNYSITGNIRREQDYNITQFLLNFTRDWICYVKKKVVKKKKP
jgi:hypothetical protein